MDKSSPVAPAPSARQLRAAAIFGVSAVGVGLLLVLGIFWGVLAY